MPMIDSVALIFEREEFLKRLYESDSLMKVKKLATSIETEPKFINYSIQ